MNRIRPKQPRFRLEPESYEHLCQEVSRRDSWRCQTCGTTSSLEVHHQQHRSQSGDDSERNPISLGAACHKNVHRGAQRRYLRTSSRRPARGSSFAVLGMNHRTRSARDRDHKQQNAEIQEVMRNDTWCAEKAGTTEQQRPVNDCHRRTDATKVVRPLRNFRLNIVPS